MGMGSIDAVLDSILEVFMTLGGSVGDALGTGLGSMANIIQPGSDGLANASGA